MERAVPSYEPVTAVLRGLTVLQTVSSLGACTVNDIHAKMGISRATIVRMLETLIFAGYVYRPAPGSYALTARTLALSAGYREASAIAYHAPLVLAALQEAVGWPSDVAVSQGVEMVTVATSPISGRLALNQPAGFRFGMLSTSMGLAYLAFAPENERVIALQALSSGTEPWSELARDPNLAAETFEAIRKRGYATIDRRASLAAYGGSLQTIGVPVMVDGKPVAAMNVIFLSEAVSLLVAVKKFLPHLRAAAERLSGLISHHA
jgi:IclR family transcriptional regulator, mhp operon transcriptional activator